MRTPPLKSCRDVEEKAQVITVKLSSSVDSAHPFSPTTNLSSPDDDEVPKLECLLLRLWRPPTFTLKGRGRGSTPLSISPRQSPPRRRMPFALASLGWSLGVLSLVSATLATLYSSILIASLWGWNGEKQTSYRKLALSIFGHRGYWTVAFFQQVASLGNNIAIHIAAGSSLKAVYKYYHKNGTLTLQHFIIFFGTFELLLSQLPDIHSLRLVNAVCTFSTIGFAGTTIGVTIYNGTKMDRGSVSYQLQGDTSTKIFRACNASGTIAFSFGDAMLPEIQATLREPVKINMYRGVLLAYGVVILSYWQIAFTGYWAFGSETRAYILASLRTPEWTIVMANVYAVVQISGCFQIYCRPTYAYFEGKMQYGSTGNLPNSYKRLVRFAFTSIYLVLITLIASAMPFFGDFVAICGAVGFTPSDFVFPALFFIKAGKMPKNVTLHRAVRFFNYSLALLFSAVAVLACTGATRSIVKDIKTYRFFYDMYNI